MEMVFVWSCYPHLIPIALKVVVKGQLNAGRDVLERIKADSQLAAHNPLLRLAVGVAGMVDEASQCSLQPQRTFAAGVKTGKAVSL